MLVEDIHVGEFYRGRDARSEGGMHDSYYIVEIDYEKNIIYYYFTNNKGDIVWTANNFSLDNFADTVTENVTHLFVSRVKPERRDRWGWMRIE